MSCDRRFPSKERIEYTETEEEKNALKQQHRAPLRQMVDLVDGEDCAPKVGEAAEADVDTQVVVDDNR